MGFVVDIGPVVGTGPVVEMGPVVGLGLVVDVDTKVEGEEITEGVDIFLLSGVGDGELGESTDGYTALQKRAMHVTVQKSMSATHFFGSDSTGDFLRSLLAAIAVRSSCRLSTSV
jgi:hypothetical protein